MFLTLFDVLLMMESVEDVLRRGFFCIWKGRWNIVKNVGGEGGGQRWGDCIYPFISRSV